MLWATGTTGDGAVAGFSQDLTTNMFHRMLINDLTAEGPLKNYLNGLSISATNHAVTPKTTLATGAAFLYGFHYWNDAALDVFLTLPVVNDTGFRVVLRSTYGATQTVRVALLESADGVSAIPAVTQTAGTLWEISLASGVVDTGGDIWKTAAKTVAGVTDLRTFVHPNIAVNAAMIDDRTRAEWFPAVIGHNFTDALEIVLASNSTAPGLVGISMPDLKTTRVYGTWIVPQDFESGLTIKAMLYNAAVSADIYGRCQAFYGACGEGATTHSDDPGVAAEAMVSSARNCLGEVSLASAAKGDLVSVYYTRTGADALDTMGAAVWLVGFVAEYTADS